MKKPQLGIFYLLVKTNKRTSNVQWRPVISNNRKAIENISGFLKFYLKNVALTIPHLLEGTRYFLELTRNVDQIPENALLVSFDVVGLCPHIAHDKCVEIMCHFLDKRKDESISSESLYRKASESLSSKCNAKA